MESKKHDPFLDLSLDIPEKYYTETDGDGRPVCNIADCLSSFTEVRCEISNYYFFFFSNRNTKTTMCNI